MHRAESLAAPAPLACIVGKEGHAEDEACLLGVFALHPRQLYAETTKLVLDRSTHGN